MPSRPVPLPDFSYVEASYIALPTDDALPAPRLT